MASICPPCPVKGIFLNPDAYAPNQGSIALNIILPTPCSREKVNESREKGNKKENNKMVSL
jgi:hypothetical protein